MRYVGAYEAKTRLPSLLDEVAGGAAITITKHGVPVARLIPVGRAGTSDVGGTISGLRVFRARHPLRGVTIRQLIDEGRR